MPAKIWRLCLLLPCLSLFATPASAQLRPLEPIDWTIFDGQNSLVASIGVGLQHNQRASLAGTVGRLIELGNIDAIWRSNRVAVQITGTMLRLFDDKWRFTPQDPSVDQRAGPHRHDSGDYTVATIVRLNPLDQNAVATLRFGTRLPNSDDRIGIDRDRTDFFALLGGRFYHDDFRIAGELGLGVNGSHDSQLDQADVLLYNASVSRGFGPVSPIITLVGRRDGAWTLRGNENVSELRVGLNAGRRNWIRAQWVCGFATYSPGWGILLSAGITR